MKNVVGGLDLENSRVDFNVLPLFVRHTDLLFPSLVLTFLRKSREKQRRKITHSETTCFHRKSIPLLHYLLPQTQFTQQAKSILPTYLYLLHLDS